MIRIMFFGRLTANKVFSTKLVYEFLESNFSGSDNKMIWKAKIPPKIQIFMWQTFRNAIPSRGKMRRRKWLGNPLCSFCRQIENVDHLFFTCPITHVVWGGDGNLFGNNTCPNSL
jgi:hypothetical protein